MLPPNRKTDFEKVLIGDFVLGEISDIKYEMEHKFVYQGKETICPGVRIIFKLEGYKFDHGTKWLKFNYGEKANLYSKYLIELVENAKPDMKFDLDNLKGMKIKTIWKERNDFQEIALIAPVNGKIKFTETPHEEEHEETTGEEIPF